MNRMGPKTKMMAPQMRLKLMPMDFSYKETVLRVMKRQVLMSPAMRVDEAEGDGPVMVSGC